MPSMFLSYNHLDKSFVIRLADRLAKSGVVVWMDETHISIGDSILEKLAEAIDQVDYVAAVISSHSIQSRWVKKELSLALSREIGQKRVVVLPILLDDCKLPTYLRDKLYADFRQDANYENECRKLLRAIGVTSNTESIQPGMWIEWTDEPGPRIIGHGLSISSAESAALLVRWREHLPKFVEQERKKGFEAANLLASMRAIYDTYYVVPLEQEMKELKSELSRKCDLFFVFTTHLARRAFSELRKDRNKKRQ